MSEKVQIVIEGKADGVKQAFDQIVTGSEKVSSALTNAGSKGAQAMATLEQGTRRADDAMVTTGNASNQMAREIETSAGRSSAAMENYSKAVSKIGASIGALVLLSSHAAGESEAAAERIRGSFENAGLAIEDFQDSIDSVASQGIKLKFDDEDVTDSIAKLLSITKNYERSIGDVALAQNIARQEQMSLAQATALVAQVEQGRYRGLVQLGVAVDATADKTEVLSTLTAKYAGAAQRFAETGAGQWEGYKVKVENTLESIGAKLANYQGQLLAVSSATTVVGSVGGALKDIGATSAIASAAMGPAGLAAAALAAGAGILYLATRTEEYIDAADQAAVSTANLDNFFASLAATLDPKRAAVVNDIYKSLIGTMTEAASRQSDLDKLLALQQWSTFDFDLNIPGIYESIEAATGLTKAQIDWINANHDTVLSLDEINSAITVYQGNLDRLSADQIKQVTSDIENLLSRPNVNFTLAASTIQQWIDQLNAGAISGEQFVALIDDAATHFSKYILSSNQATDATNSFAGAQKSLTEVLLANNSAMFGSVSATDSYTETHRRAAEQIQALGRQDQYAFYTMNQQTKQIAEMRLQTAVNTELSLTELGKQSAAAAATREAFAEWAGGMETSFYVAISGVNRWSAEQGAAFEQAKQQAASAEVLISGMLDAEAQKATAAAAALASYAAALGRVPHMEANSAYGFAARATQAGSALGDAFRVAVGNTNQIGSQSQQVADWAKQLINVKGELGQIDDLLAREVITQGEYNAAQDAGTRIFAANAAIQDDILKIQTDQAPIIAALTEETQRYWDSLAGKSADEQMVRLAYADTNEALKAQQALALAAAAANGELGAAGEASAQSLIAGAAAADPYLKALLTDMGVISVGADGTITVNFDDVKSANSDMDTLIGKLNELIDLIAQSLNIDLNSSSLATASSNLQSVNDWLNALDGKRSTVYIDTVGNLGPTGGGAEVGLHGGVMGYRGGGVVARMGESGPELLRFRGGGTALALTDGLYNVPLGTYVTPAPATKQLVGGGGNTYITIENVWANDPNQFADEMRARGFVGARG